MVTKQISKITDRVIPSSRRGVVQTAVTGIGADRVMRLVDGVFGSPVQRLFSLNLPVIGSAGPIEALNYFGHSKGKLVSKEGFVAILSAKIAQQALTQIGPVKLPGVPQNTSNAAGATTAAGASGGAAF